VKRIQFSNTIIVDFPRHLEPNRLQNLAGTRLLTYLASSGNSKPNHSFRHKINSTQSGGSLGAEFRNTLLGKG